MPKIHQDRNQVFFLKQAGISEQYFDLQGG